MKHFLKVFFIFIGFIIYAQQTDVVNFQKAQAQLRFDINEKAVYGTISYTFVILKDIDSVYLDAKKFKHVEFRLNNEAFNSEYDGRYIVVKNNFKAGSSHKLLINWTAIPEKALYFLGWENKARNQIWTQGQGKYTSNWLPSFDDMNEKVEFDLAVNFDKTYEVLANGSLINKVADEINTTWYYDMDAPMSSYLVALAIGKYKKKTEISKSGIPIELYYYPEDSTKFETTYRHTTRMFDFLEEEIGVPYPWETYKQVPVNDFLYAGMENTGLTIFADSFVTDSISFSDKNYVNVNAHELAHQWFGNLVTATSGTHHWLQEGFATYYALLAEQAVFGEDHFYWSLYESARALDSQDLSGKSTALLDPESSSLTFYQKGAWTLLMLREKVGDELFQNAIKLYLKRFQFQNASTSDFLGIVEELGQSDLTEFAYQWLRNKDFPFDEALEYLKSKSSFIQEYVMTDCEVINSKCDYYLSSGISDQAKAKIIGQVPDRITAETFKNSIKVRQAIAIALTRIPEHLKAEYESLLKDASYVTRQVALFNLWNNFPEDRMKYLEETKKSDGFSDKNIRILWLTLACVSDVVAPDESKKYLEELVDYTSSDYGFEVRQNAFQHLKWIKSCNEKCEKNLQEATSHHIWQFQKFANRLLEQQ